MEHTTNIAYVPILKIVGQYVVSIVVLMLNDFPNESFSGNLLRKRLVWMIRCMSYS